MTENSRAKEKIVERLEELPEDIKDATVRQMSDEELKTVIGAVDPSGETVRVLEGIAGTMDKSFKELFFHIYSDGSESPNYCPNCGEEL